MTRLVPLLAMVLLAGCEADDRIHAKWDGAVTVKICADGTHIYRLRDGTYNAGGFVDPVENPNTVCANL